MSNEIVTLIIKFIFDEKCKYSIDGKHNFDPYIQGNDEIVFTCKNKHPHHKSMQCGNAFPVMKIAGEPVFVVHDLLMRQIKLLENISDNANIIKALEWKFDSCGLEIFDLEGIMNLLGAIHDSYHAINEDDC